MIEQKISREEALRRERQAAQRSYSWMQAEWHDEDPEVPYVLCEFNGPEKTPYENGTFKVQVIFIQGYPGVPPERKMLTPIYHPNMSQDEGMCIGCYVAGWQSGTFSTFDIFIHETILAMITPGLREPIFGDIADEYANNREEFDRKARNQVMENNRVCEDVDEW